MLESLNNNTLEYTKLTPEEMQSRGILGRLVGIVADTFNATRNGRKYSEALWDKTFNDPIMKERIENGVCYGELGHPEDREETDMEKIAVAMDGVPKKGKDGKLRAVFNILDTPCGRILKSLCDYGSTLGVSSRGSGETYTDYDGNESVDPDSYMCQGFDIVLIPAVKEARLQYVTESLNTKKSLKESLQETINKASDNDKKIMKESLTNIGIDLNESKKDLDEDLNWNENDNFMTRVVNKVVDKFDLNKKSTAEEADDIDEELEDTPVDDNEGEDVVEQFNEALKENSELKRKIVELNEQLSVCYAKEKDYIKESVVHKKAIKKLSEEAKQSSALNETLSTLKSDLTKTKKTSIKLAENNKSLKEQLSSMTDNISSVKSKASKLVESKDKVIADKDKLIESLQKEKEDLTKQMKQQKTISENKLAKDKKLIEQYKSISQKAINKYIDSEAVKLGVESQEIRRRLPESYSFKDIDKACEEAQQYKLNVGKLPFNMSKPNLNEGIKVKAKPSMNESILGSSMSDDFVDDQLLTLAGLK